MGENATREAPSGTGRQEQATRGAEQGGENATATGTRFTTHGAIPPVVANVRHPPTSASDLAFEIGNASPEVQRARDALLATSHDPRERVMVIKRILELAETSSPEVGAQLVGIVEPYADQPAIASAIAEAHARLQRHRQLEHPSLLVGEGAAGARSFNAAHPANVAAFNAATGDACAVGGVVDVDRVALWQRAHGLEPDGKIGSATLQASAKTHEASKDEGAAPHDLTAASAQHAAGGQTNTASEGHGDGTATTGDLDAIHAAQRAQFDAEDAALNDPLYKPTHQTKVTPVEVFRAISRINSSLPHAFRVLMAAHSTGEQDHECPDNNFMGFEFPVTPPFGKPPKGKPWTRALRSDHIKLAQYQANPTYYYDMKAYGKTIARQIKEGAKELYVLWYGPRPRFETVDAAAHGFYHSIVEWRLAAFQHSKHPEHRALADAALAGDTESYIKMIETVDPELQVQAYNGTSLYPGILRPILQRAKADPRFAGADGG